MNLGLGRRSVAFGLFGLLVTSSLFAAPLAGPGMAGGATAWTPIGAEPSQPADRATVQQVREVVYIRVKDGAGIHPDLLGPALDILVAVGQEGRVDMEIVHEVSDTVPEPGTAAWVESTLVGFAEYVAFGRPIEGSLPLEAEEIWVKAAKKAALARASDRAVGRELGLDSGIGPNLGGFCKTCPQAVAAPDFVIGSYPAPGTFAFHASALTGSGDCNWYEFATLPGHRYEFRTCAPGSTSFDSIIEVFTSACSDLLTCSDEDSDDAAGCGTASAVEFVAPTGTTVIYLKISAFGLGSGAYTLAYREVACPTCANTVRELTPTTTCQYVEDGFVSGTGQCLETWFKVNLLGGETYLFTTCPTAGLNICPLANSTPLTFDTEMFLYAPLDCSLGPPLAQSTGSATCSAAPTNRANITYTTGPAGQYLLRVKGPALGSARFGCYNMGYVQTSAPACGNCASGPFLDTLTPTALCQVESGVVTSCQDSWYILNIPILSDYEFSTCSRGIPDCAGGFALFDSVIELYNSSCVLLMQDDDGCGAPRSLFCTSSGVGPLAPGTYKLRVRGGGTGAYNLTYRSCGIPCTPPSNISIVPGSGVASSGVDTCLKTETFFVTSDGSSTMTYTWQIVAPPGGMSTPPNGSMPGGAGPGNPAMFSPTLQGEGDYTVTVCATNTCAPMPPPCASITYTLLDQTPPVLNIPADTTVPCTSVPPAPILVADDNCDPNPIESFVESRIDGPCDGRYTLERVWSAIDRSGNSIGPLTQLVTVKDDIGPMIVPSSPGIFDYCMWPPNHEMHCFAASDFSPIITDNCSEPITWEILGCTNSEEGLEPCGDGNIDPDCVVSDGGQFICLRSERCGNDPALNDGRIYGIVIRARDACGNVSADTIAGQVVVVHDQSDHSDCIILE